MAALIAIALIALYFLPSIIAIGRSVPNIGSVVVLNVFLGWTFVGWVVALAMAARSQPAVIAVHQVQQNVGQALPEQLEAPTDPLAEQPPPSGAPPPSA